MLNKKNEYERKIKILKYLDDLTSTNIGENIFKIMRKLYHLNKDVVGPQINSNKDLARQL